ncbi:MAG TPA: hypothetical protein VK173_05825 [Lacibacter sp.]|nr:hypothetical protein [Lacibacter sp.]
MSYKYMMTKLLLIGAELCFAMTALIITWGSFLGGMMSAAGIIYFLTMLKVNAINQHYSGSWKKYFNSIIDSIFKIK